MAGGRPSKGEQQRHPELEELADWFDRAIEEAGYPSHNAVVRAELAHKNVVYGITNAARLFPLLQVKSYAVALGRDPAEVEPLWIRAKEAMDRAADAARRAQAPQLTSWADLPELILSVKTLLQAQARAVERLPYDMLGVAEPPLSAVYVRQRVRAPRKPAPEPSVRRGGEARNEPDQSTGSLRTEARLPVQDALARHEHLLITGEPGAGKSTLTSHLAWTLARIWLRQETSLSAPLAEPVLPVRIAAQALVGESESWSAALDHAVRRTMRLNLVADPAPWLFQSRVQGARWLVLLDGLDEITDPDARRTVVRAIAQHAQAGSDYRFVITSRPLPDAELSPLRTTTLGEYTLEPFGPEELREFAAKWFAAQFEDERQARAATDRFLDETEDSRLRELVRNPLLATIAAVNATVSPGRPLPTHRVTLYQRFFARLLSQGTPAGTARCVTACGTIRTAWSCTCGSNGTGGRCCGPWAATGWSGKDPFSKPPGTGCWRRARHHCARCRTGRRTSPTSSPAPDCWSTRKAVSASCTTPSPSTSPPRRTPTRSRPTSPLPSPGSGGRSRVRTTRCRCS
jgi:hypothetical protein